MEPKLENKKKAFEYILYKMQLWRDESPLDLDKLILFYEKTTQITYYYSTEYVLNLLDHQPITFKDDLTLERCTKFYREEYPENVLVNNKFTRLLPFIICVSTKDRQLFDFFNSFYAEQEGIVEKDINTISDYKITIEEYQKKASTEKDIDNNIPYNLIDEGIDTLRKKDVYFAHLPGNTLSFYSRRHCAWEAYLGNEIPMKILLKERSIFSADNNLLAYC